jgi:hypothetical protein
MTAGQIIAWVVVAGVAGVLRWGWVKTHTSANRRIGSRLPGWFFGSRGML